MDCMCVVDIVFDIVACVFDGAIFSTINALTSLVVMCIVIGLRILISTMIG